MSTNQTPTGNKVALIAGPTASGKSDLAVRLALALQASGQAAVVINADSAQVYADLAVLSARPTEAEMHGAPHRLFGTWDGAHACSAAEWSAAAKAEISAAHAVGAVPVLVGGTGLYIRTLLEGIAPIPEIDPAIRAEVRALPTPEAYDALQTEDPARAALLAPADSQRIARALEVVRSTRRTLGEWQQALTGGIASQITLAPLILLPDREATMARCDARFSAMLGQGAIAEVEALIARNLDPDLPVMRAIGVPEIAAYLAGTATLGESEASGQLATRQYAKRQFTWLRNQSPAAWVRIQPENVSLEREFASLLRH